MTAMHKSHLKSIEKLVQNEMAEKMGRNINNARVAAGVSGAFAHNHANYHVMGQQGIVEVLTQSRSDN